MSDQYGVIVSLDGFDAKNADPENCAIHSAYPCPKIPLTTSPNFFYYTTYTFASNPAVTSTTTMLNVNHNLGYVPASICYYQQSNVLYGFIGFQILPWYVSDAVYYTAYADCDSSNFNVFFKRTSDGGGPFDTLDLTGLEFELKYYIFVENGA